MHPHLRRQHTTMFLQVKPRTSERDEAAEHGYERWWFPPCSQPRRNVHAGDGIASVTVYPGTTGAWPGLLRGVNIDQVAAGSFASITPTICGSWQGQHARRSDADYPVR